MMLTKVFRSTALAVFCFALLACSGTRTQESTGEYIDNSAITTKVKAKLVAKLGVSSVTHISIASQKGVVYLTGSVDNANQQQRAIEIARSVGGVREVKSLLRVN